MTWAQVWLYYEACMTRLNDKEFEGELDNEDDKTPKLYPGMAGVTKLPDGSLSYGK